MNGGSEDRRVNPRLEFTYPVQFRVFSPGPGFVFFDGCLKNMSRGGACVQFKKRDRRIDSDSMEGSWVKMTLDPLQQDQGYLIAMIRWTREDTSGGEPRILMGLEFCELADWQHEKINRFISQREHDQKLMWELRDLSFSESIWNS